MAKLIFLTGAGLSAESGLRTFRDNDGLWENHSVEEICNGRTWRRNFELVHRFYNGLRLRLSTAEPNAAHRMIAAWQSRHETILLTQNVDDLLERAGCRNVVHLHGFLPELCCAKCGSIWNIGYTEWSIEKPCPECGSSRDARPRIVFFGEPAPHYETMWDALGSSSDRDVLLVIGTSGKVLPVSEIARHFQGLKILNNLTPELDIDDRLFDQIYHMPTTKASERISAALSEWFGEKR